MSAPSIVNRAEFFSDHYLEARLTNDLKDLRRAWDGAEGRGQHTARAGLRGMRTRFFNARADLVDAAPIDRSGVIRRLNGIVLEALGFEVSREEMLFVRGGGTDELVVPVAASIVTSTGPLIVAIEAEAAGEVDELFDTTVANGVSPAGRLLDPLRRDGGKITIDSVADAPGELFSVDDPPRFVLIVGRSTVLLAERSKWAEGRYLAAELDDALERADTKVGGELEQIAALFSADAIVPGHLEGSDEATSVFELLDEEQNRHAVGVSKELREGMRRSVEILANEVIQQRLASRQGVYNTIDARDLTVQCLRYLYRLIVLLYAESRPELGIIPANDEAYLAGYSLDRLRELVLVDLVDERARTGTHFDESLRKLFRLVNEGYHAEEAQAMLLFDDASPEATRSAEDYLQFPGLDAGIFDENSTKLLDSIELRNEALQEVLRLLMLNREGRRRGDQRGFISYAQLGINQLGAVYEGLMAYSGFFAPQNQALYEVAKKGDPKDGTWMVPAEDADEFPDEVFVKTTDPVSGRIERVRHEPGSFVYRLAGRDRQRSASYYTPEVLTECVVRHALAELLGTDDHARVPGGSAGITEAREILDLTICEPALGSGAFLNEAINQLSAEYLKRRQNELGETLDAETYQRELQKVKAHFALHQSYGVDLNGTAVELAEVSLWLNSMHPGLKAPWFGLRLRQGNSLVGARRATWRTSQLKKRVWAKNKAKDVSPPIDRPLAEALENDEIHHFLVPGHGWAAVADRKEAKELAPDRAKGLREWRKNILRAPGPDDAERLVALANGVERLWSEATELLTRLDRRMRRPLDLYGMEVDSEAPADERRTAEKILHNPDSALGRLRLVMDAWVGMWFWPVNTDESPPSWRQWLNVLEEIIGPEPTEPMGQLDLFADLAAIEAAEARRAEGRPPTADVLNQNPWLARAIVQAREEGAWHWELEFAPVFHRGGFDLQIGNPPWVRPRWNDDVTLAEFDPWWGVTDKAPATERKRRRADQLGPSNHRNRYLGDVALHEGLVTILGSIQLHPILTGVQTNLYMQFMELTWRHLSGRGSVGLIHPESHFVDPKAGVLRQGTYRHLRRHWQFANGLTLFEDIHHMNVFGLQVYGCQEEISFLNASRLQHPSTLDESLEHDGTGVVPAIQYPEGGWDLRPHRDRIVTIDREVLASWARLFDEPGTPAEQARLLRPVTKQDLEALSVLADQPVRLADHDYHWTRGHEEDGAKRDGIIRWDTRIPNSWDDVILQGPHFTVATPFAKQPNENCQHNQDYSDWDLETLPESLIPRTNYQRATDRQNYEANLAHWDGVPNTENWRVAWRRMTQPGLERSLQAALVPCGPSHVHTVHTAKADEKGQTVELAGLWSSIPFDYLVKVSGKGDVQDELIGRFPWPDSPFSVSLALRVLRLNALTREYSPLWSEVFESSWKEDRWTDPGFDRIRLGDVEPTWTMATPLRRDYERRFALVEIDALVALMLGLTKEQLCAMYRTQFAVLRKYEYAMAFDSEGRKICKHHQSAGYRQAQLQQEAKDKARDPKWRSVWKLFERWEEDPDSVDWEGQYTPPFTRVDREAEMTRAYNEFQRRLEAGEYG